MKILITGKTGVGKTAILKQLKNKNVIHMDDVVKNKLYVSTHPCFKQVVNHFGDEIVTNGSIDTSKLGKIVLTNPTEMEILSLIVNPYVYHEIKNLGTDYIIEMAAYAKYESLFKELFDKVIVIQRENQDLEEKFKYLDKPVNPLNIEPKEYDVIIRNNNTLEEAVKNLEEEIPFQ